MRKNKTSELISELKYPLKNMSIIWQKALSVAQTRYFEISLEIHLQSYQFEFVGCWAL